MSAILDALQSGKSPISILEFIKRLDPKLATYIASAQAAGKSTEKILSYLSQYGDKIDKNLKSTTTYRNPYEQAQKGSTEAVSNIAKIGAMTASLAGGYALARNAMRGASAVYPSEILPAQRAVGYQPQQAIGFQSPRGLPAPGAPGIPKPGVSQTPSMPSGPTIEMGMRPPQSVMPTKETMLQQGFNPKEVDAAIKIKQNQQESEKLWELAKKKGSKISVPQENKDFMRIAKVLVQTGTIANQEKFDQFLKYWKATEGKPRLPPVAEYEKFRVMTKGWTEPESQGIAPTQTEIPQQAPASQPQQTPIQTNEKPIQQPKIKQAAFGSEPLKKLSEAKPLSERSFAIPTYKRPNESQEEFQNREILDSAVEKAAQALQEGKSFLDFPEPFGKVDVTEKIISRGPRKGEVEKKVKHERFTRAVAADVLRFMAGIDNPLDPLLDDEEREELNYKLWYEGNPNIQAATPSGDPNIYGAQLPKNMIWNLLLNVEPRLQNIEMPNSVKGTPSGKMTPDELRRNLAHAVSGVVSGKKITTKLKDKITKISETVTHMNILANMIKENDMNELLKEAEKLSESDEEFFNLFSDEILERARKLK